MNTNSRFAVGIHALTLLAARPGETLTSEYIACSVGTHPVVIRRLLASLRGAGLVSSQSGQGGGWGLQLGPDEISLRDIYQALEDGLPFALPRQEPDPECAIGGCIKQAVEGVFDEVEEVIGQRLARTTVAEVLRRVRDAKRSR